MIRSWGTLLICTLPAVACGSSGEDGETRDSDTRKPGGGDQTVDPEIVETTGGADPPAFQVEQGTVTIIGSSDAVPVANRSFSGFRQPEINGEELVRCNFYPDGNAEFPVPHAEILAGIQGREHYQAQAQLFRYSVGETVSIPFDPEDTLEDGSQEMILFASLTHDSEADAYRYWYARDEYAYPPVGPQCEVTITEFDEERLIGAIECIDLIPTTDSPDAPVTHAPSPTAQISLQFDCPFVRRDPGGGTATKLDRGTCTGTAYPCLLLDVFECSQTAGCSPTGNCNGIPRSCDEYVEFYSCESQSGCYWSGYDCYGFAKSCFSFDGDEVSCLLHDGCDWTDDCEGQERPCGSYETRDTCEERGCTWDN